MPTPKKAATIDELHQMFARAKLTVIADYRGLKVSDLQGLRAALRPINGEARVAKNTLATLAAERAGIPQLADYLVGPTIVIVSYDDPVPVAKAVGDFARTSRILAVRGGMVGQRPLAEADVAAIAALPTRDVLIGRVVGQIQAPLYGLVGVLSGVIRQFGYVLQARIEQLGGETGDAAPAAVAEAPADD